VPRQSLPRMIAAAIAAGGTITVLVGLVLMTLFTPSSALTARLDPPEDTQVVEGVPGTGELLGDQVTVKVTGAQGSIAFVGVGRAEDVAAYLAQVRRLQVVGTGAGGTLTTVPKGSAPATGLSDPRESDIWEVRGTGTTSASVTWHKRPGQWRLVALARGSGGAPASLHNVRLNWREKMSRSTAAEVIAVGVLVLVCGCLAIGLTWPRQERPRGVDWL